MDSKKIKKFIEIAKESKATKLSYEEKDFKVSVSFESSSPIVNHSVVPTAQVSTTAPKASTAAVGGENFHLIKAPFIGTFYSSASPGEPSYVNVGDKVSKSQTLCILEAMKIMNEIDADVNGTIVEVCVENESFVEYGQVLFKIEKA